VEPLCNLGGRAKEPEYLTLCGPVYSARRQGVVAVRLGVGWMRDRAAAGLSRAKAR
jgi:hypothetical protein